MRLIGLAELVLELACVRASERTAFGKPLANLGGNRERIADARIAIEQARLHVLHTAWLVDQKAPEAAGAAAQIKVAVPNMAQRVVDMAIQLHGGAGLSNDLPLAAPGPPLARCDSRTAPTRCTAASSPAWSSPATARGSGPPERSACALASGHELRKTTKGLLDARQAVIAQRPGQLLAPEDSHTAQAAHDRIGRRRGQWAAVAAGQQRHSTAGGEDAHDLFERLHRLLDQIQRGEAADSVEGLVAEWQRAGIGAHVGRVRVRAVAGGEREHRR